ncbi:MAG TPA: ABC transporter ATP-binding protein [Anaerolineales bacterium]|nr:ABC transporter ATP-binding protein [Anaerolineales bacterium]
MILSQDLSKQFDDFIAVDGVNLEVGTGQVLALLGPNGAGKTTTIRMLTSILKPTRGWARVGGYDVVREPDRVRAAVGVLTEQHGLYSRMPAGDYLDFFGQLYGLDLATRRARIERLLGDFGLLEAQAKRLGEYSKGMRQKLALARALLHQPPVLLLDEPTSAMDPESARLVRNAIAELRSSERAIIVCTHNLAEAEELADQIAIIRKGKIIVQGSPRSLKKEMLGAPEFEVRLSTPLNGRAWSLPEGTLLTASGEHWFRFSSPAPEVYNPRVLRVLLDVGFAVVSLQEQPRSLEAVYMQAMNGAGQPEAGQPEAGQPGGEQR